LLRELAKLELFEFVNPTAGRVVEKDEFAETGATSFAELASGLGTT